MLVLDGFVGGMYKYKRDGEGQWEMWESEGVRLCAYRIYIERSKERRGKK